MSKRIERPQVLEGATYKIRTPIHDHAIYITVNDLVEEGKPPRPVEVFINSKEMENFELISALTRLISAVLRQEGEFPEFVLQELEDTYNLMGGYYIPGMKGDHAHGLVSHIGRVLRKHCERVGVVPAKKERR